MPFGAEVEESGRVRFRIFAPSAASMKLQIEGQIEPLVMHTHADGWHELTTSEARTGTRYRFVLPDGTQVPDPASRFQPQDVFGPSEVIDPSVYLWHDRGWRGRPWVEAVLYELHVGAFTAAGTFRSAIARLDHLAALGVTAIELMSIADFAGRRNWGYDGVLLYAPDSAYGRPEDLKAFIEAAHARGLMVILDVVYNHFGPEGNYLPRYFPQICSERHCTPWGQALNFDGECSRQVREFIIQNALYWIEEFHADGLRLDAAHAMIDTSSTHILDELADRIHGLAGDRIVHLVLENEQNVAERLIRDADGKPKRYTAQWNHDITHLLGASMAQSCTERQMDDHGETDNLGKALAEGFVIAAQMRDQTRGQPDARLAVPPTAFTAFIQTHDLVGNRIFGDRIHAIAAPEAVRAIASIYLLLPQIPMLFMGEEWAASTPFPFFSDYHGDLAEAVRRGRCEQLSKLDPKPDLAELARAPDPQAEETFNSAKLKWDETSETFHAEWLEFYKRLLRVRAESIVPLLYGPTESSGSYKVVGLGALSIRWTLADGKTLHLDANLCWQPTRGFSAAAGRVIWPQGSALAADELGPWSVRWSMAEAAIETLS